MTKYSIAFLNMVYALLAFFDKNAEKIKDNAIIQGAVTVIRSLVKLIEYFRPIQSRITTGITKTKRESKARLAQILYLISGIERTYAFDSENHLIYDAVKKSISALMRMGDTTLLTYTDNVKKFALENFKELQAYGLTQEMIDELEACQKDFVDKMTKTREAITEKANATSEIKLNVKKLRKVIVGKLDNAMLAYFKTDSVFYNEYLKIRAVVDPATHHLDLYGYGKDEETRLALQNIKVEIFKVGQELASIVKLTTATGYFRFKSLEPGEYIVRFSLKDYDTLEKELELYPGQSKRLDIFLRKTE